MFPEARIDIHLVPEAGRVARAEIRSTRLVHAARLFAGRRPSDIIALLPSVFSLCGTAQKLACLAALESALGIVPTAARTRRRRVDLLAETVAEHGLAMLRDWPALAGEPVDLSPAKALRLALAARDIPAAAALFTRILGGPPDRILGDGFRAWMNGAATAAARLCAELDPGFGAAAFHPMPAAGPADLATRLAGDESYCARPDCGGIVLETGPLARHAGHPLVAALLAEYGSGLLPRFAARLVETASALRELEELVQDLPDDAGAAIPDGSGAGTGVVEAARGLLAHRIELEDGVVTSYRILAPTEWNFHPAGPLAAGLAGAPADPQRARLLVHALDPCVACTVTVEPSHA